MVDTAYVAAIVLLFRDSDLLTTAIGVADTCYGLGWALGPVIGGPLYAAGGYKLPFLVTGGVTLVLGAPVVLLLLPQGLFGPFSIPSCHGCDAPVFWHALGSARDRCIHGSSCVISQQTTWLTERTSWVDSRFYFCNLVVIGLISSLVCCAPADLRPQGKLEVGDDALPAGPTIGLRQLLSHPLLWLVLLACAMGTAGKPAWKLSACDPLGNSVGWWRLRRMLCHANIHAQRGRTSHVQ